MILVDTSVWIDFLRGARSAERLALHRLIEEEDLAITGIVLAEVLQGIGSDRDFRAVRELLLEFPVYEPAGTGTYLKAARLYRECRKRGKTVRKTVDCIIAALCMENGLTLLHKDRDFERIEVCSGLKVLKV
jgi:predicted nucleic acid-binding protein